MGKVKWVPIFDESGVEVRSVSQEWLDFANETFDECFKEIARKIKEELDG